jgi:sulfite reductase (NADPH) flavoprotein alpha-component
MRFLLAAIVIATYVVFTVAVLRAHRRKAAREMAAAHGALCAGGDPGQTSAVSSGSATSSGSPASGASAALTPSAPSAASPPAPMLVAYASQSGYAEQIANQTARALHAANIPSRVRSLAELSIEELSATERALFVVSTYGEGDPPDTGLSFVSSVMSRSPMLSRLAFGVLALGDRTYRNFCGFGKTLDGWLRRQCAVPMFDLVEVDNADEAALLHWQRHIGALGGNTPVWTAPRNDRWQIAGRKLLNPGSAGHPCFHIELKPTDGTKMHWSAGDIAVLTPPGTNAREYSIASMPAEGSLHILVRQSRRADGTLGIASGWLTEAAKIGSEIPLRIRTNSNFHSPADARPVILIGNGTGIAGLRSHLKAREGVRGARNWLIFGERNAAHDSFYEQDIERWRASGVLTRVDYAFSRDQDERVYVQHVVQRFGEEIREWVADGAVIYVCGSAAGMATAVDEALAAALGRDRLYELLSQRRYRRDVY